MESAFGDDLRNFWTPFLAFADLLGVYLVVLGIALAGLVSAQRQRAQQRDRLVDSSHAASEPGPSLPWTTCPWE